ncbi:MAG: SusC/RagA family TonB-linked outer membrane protein [Bacteroidota bacterium]|nr:SusC/RagA family TonB-linked outer membrane protein [Bacteroidota bacterium]
MDSPKQSIAVQGVVKDIDGQALEGVRVVVKGTTNGTMTDENGKFQLTTPENTTLVFSILGSGTQEVQASQKMLNVVMKESSRQLKDVIVTGVAAGVQKEKLSFSIEKISADKQLIVPATEVGSALNGKIAGIHVTQKSGAPGSGVDVQLRGVKTIFGSSNPLYIIDGVMTENGVADINAEDIESIEVLKGAAASSLYGSRAANGVVSIITRRGGAMGAGKFQVDVRSEFGKSSLGYVPEQSKSTNATIENGVVNYGVVEPNQVYDNPYPKVYDHIKQFYDAGAYFTTHAAISGTSNDSKMSVYSALQTTKESGIVKLVDGINRTNIRINLDYRITDQLVFTTSNLYALTNSDNRADGAFGLLYRCDPAADLLAKNEGGAPYLVNVNKINDVVNPLYVINNTVNKSTTEKLISFFQFKYNPTNYLSFSTSYGTTRNNGESLYLSPKGLLNYDLTASTGYISRGMSKDIEQSFDVDGLFYKKFGDFNTKFKLKYLYESSGSTSLSGGGSDLGISGTNITTVNLSSNQSASSSIYKTISNSLAGMLVFDYKDKYIFDGLVRRDASSLFGSDVRWQTFCRLSGAWRITQDFVIPGVEEWKIRASYGTAGLRPPFEAQYETFALVNGVPGNMETLGNAHLKPSFSKETELGTDMRFLEKWTFSCNYSLANNTDQILKVPISPLSGAAYQWQNAGTLQTKAFEATLGTDLISKKDIAWNVGLTFDKLKQKITKLNCTPYMLDGTRFMIKEGVDFGVLYLDKFATSLSEVANQVPKGRTADEVFAINNQGFVVLKSQIGTVDENPVKVKDDAGNILSLPTKNLMPNFNMNLNSTFRYKRFSLYTLFAYQNGGYVYDHAVRYMTEPSLFDQSGKPWNEVKAATYYSNGGQTTGLLGWDNDVLLFNATFLKIREMSVSYDFVPTSLNKQIKNIKLSLIGRNLLTLTNYPGFDPEGVQGKSDEGVDTNTFRFESNDQYPLSRTISGSVALTF